MHNKQHWLSRLGLGSYSPLDDRTIEFIESHLVFKRFAKGEIILEPGKPFDKICFIRSGLVKGFYKLPPYEVVNWISSENEVFTSSKYFSNSTGNEFIQAIEATTVDYLSFDDVNLATKNFRAFRDLRLKMLEEYYCYAEERAMLARIPNASMRIQVFRVRFPQAYFDRVPAKDIASFLGMTPETYSRLK